MTAAVMGGMRGEIVSRHLSHSYSPPSFHEEFPNMTDELKPIGHCVATKESGIGGEWWPGDLGTASVFGEANGVRFAVLPEIRRIAIATGGSIQLYDAGDRVISGVAEFQDENQSLLFKTDSGIVRAVELNKIKV
jgi:hypothetical protein